ncbi:MAG: hypothetical protein RLY97_1320 [Pseudomonadota bacterium]
MWCMPPAAPDRPELVEGLAFLPENVPRTFSFRQKWCGRGDLNPHGQSPTNFLTRHGFHRRPPCDICHMRGVWSLDYPFTIFPAWPENLGAARLVSTPSQRMKPQGLARDCHLTGFPEFGQFYVSGFPLRTQFTHKSVASTDSATPALCRCL